MTPQPNRPATSGRVRGHLGALTGRYQGQLTEGPYAEGGRQGGAVPQGHFLIGIEGRKAVLGFAFPAGPALPADRPPVEHYEGPGVEALDIGADVDHLTGRLMA